MPGFVRSCSSLPMLDNYAIGGGGVGNTGSGTETCTPTIGSLPGTYSLVGISTVSTNWINSYTMSVTSNLGGTWTKLSGAVFRGPSGQSTMSLTVFLNTAPVAGSQTLTCTFSSSGGSWLDGQVYIMAASYSGCVGYQNITTQGSGTSSNAALNISQVSAPNHRAVCFCTTATDYHTTFNNNMVVAQNLASSHALYSFIGDAPGATGISFATTANNSWCGGYSLDLM